MKKLIVCSMLAIGMSGAFVSYGQGGKKTEKKEIKMDKKENKGKNIQATRKANKAVKKEVKDK